MPTYEYHCISCEHTCDTFQKITDDPIIQCPNCKKEALRRGPGGGIGLLFKGKGFYITDYKKNPPKEKIKSESCPCGKKEQACSQEK